MNELLTEKEKTHGDYRINALLAQTLKEKFRESPNYRFLAAAQRESLDLIATKLARILCGDYSCVDHWLDAAGYFQLIVEQLTPPTNPSDTSS